MEIMSTPGEVVLNKDKLLVISFGAGGSSCGRIRMEVWSREKLTVLQII